MKIIINEEQLKLIIRENNILDRNNIDKENLSYLGKGDFGVAYYVDDDKVLKITTSKNEYELAKKIKLNPCGNFVKIFDIDEINGEYYILQELLDTDSDIENLFYELDYILNQQNLPIQYVHMLDYDELDYDISDELKNFINDIEDINRCYRNLGIEASDIKYENLAYDENGKLKAFDIQDRKFTIK